MTITTDASQVLSLDEGLFPVADAWAGDPIRPGMDAPTPAAIVASLSRNDRALRVRNLTQQAHDIVDLSLAVHLDGKTLAASVLLFSGGNDSTTLGHIVRKRVTHVGMANTGTGIPETLQFVRDTAAAWRLPVIEKHPPQTYRSLVLDPYVVEKTGRVMPPRGFPGPAKHPQMYQRLKERCFEQIRTDLVGDQYRTHRLLFIAGRRRAESAMRANKPAHERRGSTIWASPVINWTKLDLNTYRTLHDVPTNPVANHLHMSAECLCGANAKPGELEYIADMGYDVTHLRDLERDARAAGIPEPLCRWGHGEGRQPDMSKTLCDGCSPLDFDEEATA